MRENSELKGFYEGKNVLVTGGASFIGSRLVEELLNLGAKVRIAENFSSGSELLGLSNLAAVREKIEIFRGDLRNPEFAAQVASSQNMVFHLAAAHGGRGYIESHPVDCAKNLILDGNMFSAAQKAGVDRICFTSSACVYSAVDQTVTKDGHALPLREEMVDPTSMKGCAADTEYGWAKLMGEMTLKAYYKQYGQKSVSCRLFNVYGERENETHALIALIARAYIDADPYLIWGNGEQDRNFTYVGDIVEGLMRACMKVTDASAINIGTTAHIKINDAVSEIFKILGKKPKRFFHDLSKPVGVQSRAADQTRCRELLGWVPTTSFTDGLRRTIDWYCSTHEVSKVRAQLEGSLNER